MRRTELLGLLRSIVAILTRANETRWIPVIEKRITAFNGVHSDTTKYQEAVRETLRLYSGMGSFQDLVLQNEKGVLPEQGDLAKLRHDLFMVLRAELR